MSSPYELTRYGSEAELLAALDTESRNPTKIFDPAIYEGLQDELGISPEEIHDMGYGYEAGDEFLKVKFDEIKTRLTEKSKLARRSIWETRLAVVIDIPCRHGKGNQFSTEIDESTRDYWMARFPKQFKAYLRNKIAPIDVSKLLTSWPFLKDVERANLESFKIISVDQLAKIDDKTLAKAKEIIPSIEKLKSKATQYLAFLDADEKETTKTKR
jgi:hypothetical protein